MAGHSVGYEDSYTEDCSLRGSGQDTLVEETVVQKVERLEKEVRQLVRVRDVVVPQLEARLRHAEAAETEIITDLQNKLKESEALVQELQEKFVELGTKLEEQETLKNQIGQLQEENRELRSQLGEPEAGRRDQAAQQIAHLEKQLKDSEELVSVLQNHLESGQPRNSGRDDGAFRLCNGTHDSEEDTEPKLLYDHITQEEAREYKDTAHKFQAMYEDIKKAYEERQDIFLSRELELCDMMITQQSLNDAKKKIQAMKSEMAGKDEDFRALRGAYQKLIREHEKTEFRATVLQRKVAEMEKAASDSATSKEDLQELRSQVVLLERRVRYKEKEVVSLQNSLGEVRERYDGLLKQKRYDEALSHRKISQLEDSCAEYQRALGDMIVHSDVERITQKMSSLISDNDGKTSEIAVLEKMHHKERMTNRRLEAELERMSARMKQMENERQGLLSVISRERSKTLQEQFPIKKKQEIPSQGADKVQPRHSEAFGATQKSYAQKAAKAETPCSPIVTKEKVETPSQRHIDQAVARTAPTNLCAHNLSPWYRQVYDEQERSCDYQSLPTQRPGQRQPQLPVLSHSLSLTMGRTSGTLLMSHHLRPGLGSSRSAPYSTSPPREADV